jgi:hypothetical protein
MPDPMQRADRFMLDAMRLGYALDAVTARDLPDCITEVARRGNLIYAELMISAELRVALLRRRDAD